MTKLAEPGAFQACVCEVNAGIESMGLYYRICGEFILRKLQVAA
ncbi:MAG TPA: hypothetical protein PK490_15280 [Prosthecobacter sp.]|nr:hypothetical protein [Prosthecobacter sp.]HRK15642.1 hypothetical protein [Prosthecobacter sp.]